MVRARRSLPARLCQRSRPPHGKCNGDISKQVRWLRSKNLAITRVLGTSVNLGRSDASCAKVVNGFEKAGMMFENEQGIVQK